MAHEAQKLLDDLERQINPTTRVEARQVRAGMRVKLDGQVKDIELTGPTGLYRGTVMLFAVDEVRGRSVPADKMIEVLD